MPRARIFAMDGALICSLLFCAGLFSCKAPDRTESALAAAVGAEDRWVRFTDPQEQAFTLEVPRGWTVRGEMLRFGFSDTRVLVDLQSPDGKIHARLGDPAVPVYFEPDRLHPKEGQPHELPGLAIGTIAHYYTGGQYAELYAESRYQKECPKVTALPDPGPIADPTPDDTASAVANNTRGEVSYRCETVNGPQVLYTYARTTRYAVAPPPGSPSFVQTTYFWIVSSLDSYLAPPDQVARVTEVLDHVSRTFQINPQWRLYQQKMDAEGMQYTREIAARKMSALSQQVAEFKQRMQAMRSQVANFEAGQARKEEVFEGMDDTINGVERTVDPLTGINYKVDIGAANNHYINGLGTIVNANQNPGVANGWRELEPAPR